MPEDLATRLTARPLSTRDLTWIESQLAHIPDPFARLLLLLVLLDARKARHRGER